MRCARPVTDDVLSPAAKRRLDEIYTYSIRGQVQAQHFAGAYLDGLFA